MKKLFLTLLLGIIAGMPCAADGDDNDEGNEVPMAQSTAGNGHNRGQNELPVVYYNGATGVMTVTFLAEETYRLIVTDDSGVIVYNVPVNTGGCPTAYLVNLPAPAAYLVSITSVSETYTGTLLLE